MRMATVSSVVPAVNSATKSLSSANGFGSRMDLLHRRSRREAIDGGTGGGREIVDDGPRGAAAVNGETCADRLIERRRAHGLCGLHHEVVSSGEARELIGHRWHRWSYWSPTYRSRHRRNCFHSSPGTAGSWLPKFPRQRRSYYCYWCRRLPSPRQRPKQSAAKAMRDSSVSSRQARLRGLRDLPDDGGENRRERDMLGDSW